MDASHRRPEGLDDDTVAALGKLSEALETTEQARGHLYAMHQFTGRADRQLGDAVDLLRRAGHQGLADRIETELLGRNVLPGRWTYQIVEEYDDGYYLWFKTLERQARESLALGRRHLFEAELKERRRSHGLPGHECTPQEVER